MLLKIATECLVDGTRLEF